MERLTLARSGVPSEAKWSKSTLTLSTIPSRINPPHSKRTLPIASSRFLPRLPGRGRTKRSTMPVFSRTERGASSVPSSAVSKTSSNESTVALAPTNVRGVRARVSPPSIWFDSASRSEVGLNCTAIVFSTRGGLPVEISDSLAFARVGIGSALHQPQALVGDVQLFDGDLAGPGVELGPAQAHRQAAVEHPGGHHLVAHAEHLDDAVVARHRPLAGDDRLQPLPEVAVDLAGVGVEHPPLQHQVLVLGAADAADDAVVAAALQVLLDVHLDLQPGALLERAVGERGAAAGAHAGAEAEAGAGRERRRGAHPGADPRRERRRGREAGRGRGAGPPGLPRRALAELDLEAEAAQKARGHRLSPPPSACRRRRAPGAARGTRWAPPGPRPPRRRDGRGRATSAGSGRRRSARRRPPPRARRGRRRPPTAGAARGSGSGAPRPTAPACWARRPATRSRARAPAAAPSSAAAP